MSTTERRTRRTLAVVVLVVGLLVLGAGAVAVLGFCSVFGCSALAEDFEPHGQRAIAARAAATGDVGRLADRLVAGRPVLADASADGCTTGQDNWKRKDTHSHECSVVDSRVVLVTTDVEAVADGLTAADAALREAGCRPVSARSGLDRVRDEYWAGRDPQARRRGAAGLPDARYTCAGSLTVEARPTSAQGDSTDLGVALAPELFDDTLASSWYTAEDLRALRASRARLAMVLTVKDGYYRTRF